MKFLLPLIIDNTFNIVHLIVKLTKSETELIEKLEALLVELQPFERKLNDAGRRMRLKLQKEVTDYKEDQGEFHDQGDAER
jgi:hypothetical protein